MDAAARLAWEELVRQAALANDGEALRDLYEQGRRELGPAVDHAWATALAAFDATAVTG